ncbi:hypothetical protein ACFE04_030507 [Oxalis oulophora]
MSTTSLISILFLVFLSLSSIGFSSAKTLPYLDGLLSNGDFEIGPNPSKIKDINVIDGKYSLPGWEIDGTAQFITGGPQVRDFYVYVPRGIHAVMLQNKTSISQNVKVKPGFVYSLTFGAGRTCYLNEMIKVSAAGQSSQVIYLSQTYSSRNNDTYAWAFKAISDTVKVTFENPKAEADVPFCGPLLDAVAIKELLPMKFAGGNLVKNGDFEIGPYTYKNYSTAVLILPEQKGQISPVPGWFVESSKPVKYIDRKHYSVPSGLAAIELISGPNSTISQVIRTVTNQLYTLTFSIGDANDGCPASMVVKVLAGDKNVNFSYKSIGKGGFKVASLKFKAISVRTKITFSSGKNNFKVSDAEDYCGPVLDNVQVYHTK